jgi:hypothetical protein
VPELANLGVDVLRISPVERHFENFEISTLPGKAPSQEYWMKNCQLATRQGLRWLFA